MTQEQKDLLLKDLCGRLPYGVKVKIKHYDDAWKLLAIYTNGTTYATRDIGYPIETCFEDCKPYLFPLSSMTEEQKNELSKYLDANVFVKNEISFWSLFAANMMDKWKMVFEWCNKNHFDVYGLIPMGLAKDATGLNIY